MISLPNKLTNIHLTNFWITIIRFESTRCWRIRNTKCNMFIKTTHWLWSLVWQTETSTKNCRWLPIFGIIKPHCWVEANKWTATETFYFICCWYAVCHIFDHDISNFFRWTFVKQTIQCYGKKWKAKLITRLYIVTLFLLEWFYLLIGWLVNWFIVDSSFDHLSVYFYDFLSVC